MYIGMVMEGRSQSTFIYMRWSLPPGNCSSIIFHFISVQNLNSSVDTGEVVINATNNATSFNVTGLLPGTTYAVTVSVVAVCNDYNTIATRNFNNTVIRTTLLTGLKLIIIIIHKYL